MFTRCLLLGSVVALTIGCGGSSGDPTSPPVTVATVSVSPDAPSVVSGSSVQLSATVKDSKGNALSGRTVVWSSTSDAVASVSTNGLVSAVAVGTAQIRATSEGITGSASLTVTPVPVSTVTLSSAAVTLVPNQPATLTATPKDAQGNILTGRVVAWTSSADAVATVNQSGGVTALAAGTATITATSETKIAQATITVLEGGWLTTSGGIIGTSDGNVSISAPAAAVQGPTPVTVNVVGAPVANPLLIANTAYDFGPNGTQFAQPVTISIRYSQASIGAATPSQFRLHRLTNGAWVPVVGSTVNVTTRMATGQTNSFSTYAILEVQPVVAVTVTPASSQLLTGSTLQLTAIARNGAGAALNGRLITWQSSDITRASVSATGLVTAVGAGAVTITATSEGVPGTASVEIVTATNIPTFSRPFAGEFQTGNFMDHDIPKEFVDNNNIFTTFWGEVLPGRGGMVDGHSGYDWPMPIGVPMLAVADGRIAIASTSNPDFFCPPLNRIVNDQMTVGIEHALPGGTFVISIYTHLSRVDVALNQQVTRGQVVGLSGNTGCSGAAHLHFETLRRLPTRNVTIDPYGWSGTAPDPWAQHVDGTTSIQLWKTGEAPPLFKQVTIDFLQNPVSAPAVLSKVVFMGERDDQNPNNEYAEISLDTRVTAQQSLDGYRLRGDKSGLNFLFPGGIVLNASRPVIRVYSGSGTATATNIYMGQSSGIWSNLRNDDCARLVAPGGGQYRLNLGNACPLPGPAIQASSLIIDPALARRGSRR